MGTLPLRKSGPLVEPFEWPIKSDEDPPRALKTLARIIDNDLCHRCGSCIGICPTKVLGVDKRDFPVVENLSACTDCDLCVKVCPGDEFGVESVARQLFGLLPDIKDMHGYFQSAYLSYATNVELREKSTSGGLVTALLVSLLERNLIDGAVVIAADEHILWKGKPIIARSKKEIIAATKSKYAISPTNKTFEEIRSIKGRYALVGLPCQIHGFHKAARLDARIRTRVIVTIGLFCHAAVDHQPFEYIWENLGDAKDKAVKFVSRVGKHPGSPHVVLDDGTMQPVYFPNAAGYRPNSMEILNILYRLYTPPRCLTCYDATAEFADIAVGDPWMPPPDDKTNFYNGYSFVLARTEKAKELLEQTRDAEAITLRELTAKEARTSNKMMGTEKRYRAFRIIETRRRQGHAIPQYGFEIPKTSGKHFILTELNMLSHLFCFLPRGQQQMLRLLFSPFGYALLWLNHKRRVFRTWRRDAFASCRRRSSRGKTLSLFLFIYALVSTSTEFQDAFAEAVKIGVLAPLTSVRADAGNYMKNGLLIAEQEIRNDRTLEFLVLDTAFAPSYLKNFLPVLEKKQKKVGLIEEYVAETTDFRPQLLRIKKQDPKDIFLIGAPKHAGLILRQANELGLKAQFYNVGVKSPELLVTADNLANGLIYPYSYDNQSSETHVQKFASQYQQWYGQEPNTIAANTYDAAYLLSNCFEQHGLQVEKVKSCLYRVTDHQGASGTFSIDHNGDAVKQLIVKTVKNKKFIVYTNNNRGAGEKQNAL